MTIEQALVAAIAKPWGVVDLGPWSRAGPGRAANDDDAPIGELRYERSNCSAKEPSLLLKLLLTSQPLSIQVHPDDAFARSIGLPGGKTEAWCVLSAEPGSQIALGLTERLSPEQFRKALDGGSISDLVLWREAFAGDVFHVPPGTIHAIGAGIVLAEIQQRNDVTFRFFDYGRPRELHMERAFAVADAGPANFRVSPRSLTNQRTLLAANAHFVFERIDLPSRSTWCVDAQRETWMLAIAGDGTTGSIHISVGDAIFAQLDSAYIQAGADGLSLLAAYTTGGPVPGLFQRVGRDSASVDSARSTMERAP